MVWKWYETNAPKQKNEVMELETSHNEKCRTEKFQAKKENEV